MLKRILRWFGFLPPPIEMRGIYGVTEDGCYLVRGPDGVLRKSHPLAPPHSRDERTGEKHDT